MNDPNNNDAELRLVGADRPARVVLAEVDAPGSLHYLLEAEGFRVVGSASDEHDLTRVLQQDLTPDVIVLDADVSATSVVAARHLASSAHVVVIWPDGVQAPPGAERVSPAHVYEELGPTIRRHMDKRRVPEPIITLPADEEPLVAATAVAPGAAVGRAASRVSLTTVTLIVAIVLTMGASFALGGYRARLTSEPPMAAAPGPSVDPDGVVSDRSTGRDAIGVVPAGGSERCARAGDGHGAAAAEATSCVVGRDNAHHDRPPGQAGDPGGSIPVPTGGGPDVGGGTPVDPGGGTPVDPGGGTPVDPGGGGQGDQGGGGHGDQGGGGHGDQGGGNHDDQGEDEQGDQDDQGQNDDDQGEDEQGDAGSPGDTHGTQSDDQG